MTTAVTRSFRRLCCTTGNSPPTRPPICQTRSRLLRVRVRHGVPTTKMTVPVAVGVRNREGCGAEGEGQRTLAIRDGAAVGEVGNERRVPRSRENDLKRIDDVTAAVSDSFLQSFQRTINCR